MGDQNTFMLSGKVNKLDASFTKNNKEMWKMEIVTTLSDKFPGKTVPVVYFAEDKDIQPEIGQSVFISGYINTFEKDGQNGTFYNVSLNAQSIHYSNQVGYADAEKKETVDDFDDQDIPF